MNYSIREEIRKRYRNRINEGLRSPYAVYDWPSVFTPIEMNFWGTIRYIGAPFYPQYPVGRFFIDFADPAKKLGIEIDSRQWHSGRKDQDVARNEELNEMGWEVWHVPGFMTYNDQAEKFLLQLLVENYNEEPLHNTWTNLYKAFDAKEEIYD